MKKSTKATPNAARESAGAARLRRKRAIPKPEAPKDFFGFSKAAKAAPKAPKAAPKAKAPKAAPKAPKAAPKAPKAAPKAKAPKAAPKAPRAAPKAKAHPHADLSNLTDPLMMAAQRDRAHKDSAKRIAAQQRAEKASRAAERGALRERARIEGAEVKQARGTLRERTKGAKSTCGAGRVHAKSVCDAARLEAKTSCQAAHKLAHETREELDARRAKLHATRSNLRAGQKPRSTKASESIDFDAQNISEEWEADFRIWAKGKPKRLVRTPSGWRKAPPKPGHMEGWATRWEVFLEAMEAERSDGPIHMARAARIERDLAREQEARAREWNVWRVKIDHLMIRVLRARAASAKARTKAAELRALTDASRLHHELVDLVKDAEAAMGERFSAELGAIDVPHAPPVSRRPQRGSATHRSAARPGGLTMRRRLRDPEKPPF